MRSLPCLRSIRWVSRLREGTRFWRLLGAAICLLSLLPTSAAQALTIEAPLATGGGSNQILTTYEILGVSFSDELGWLEIEKALLFEGLVLSPSIVGTTVYSYSVDGIEFDRAVAFLTNGIDGYVLIGREDSLGGIGASGAVESMMFAHDPLSTGGPDAAGMIVTQIGFRLDSLAIETPGSDPNGDGIWTDVRIGATILIEGELAPDAALPLSRSQQTCVHWMNKSGEMINRIKLQQNERCMIDYQRERLESPMTFGRCVDSDRNGRLNKAKQQTVTREDHKCVPLDALPLFAYTDARTVRVTAEAGSSSLVNRIFGNASSNGTGLATRSSDPQAARCQLEVLKRAGKLENAILKELVVAARRALRDETVGNGWVLGSRLEEVYASSARVERARRALLSGVERRCAAIDAPPAEIFAGHCGEGNPDIGDVERCAIAEAQCAACAIINAIDDLHLDCDQLDDEIENGSCFLFATVAVGRTNADCFPSSVPDSAPWIVKACVQLANSAPNYPFTPADYQAMPEECKYLVDPSCR